MTFKEFLTLLDALADLLLTVLKGVAGIWAIWTFFDGMDDLRAGRWEPTVARMLVCLVLLTWFWQPRKKS